jgi:hypothetical protein
VNNGEYLIKRSYFGFNLSLIIIFSPFEEAGIHVSQFASDNIPHRIIFLTFA